MARSASLPQSSALAGAGPDQHLSRQCCVTWQACHRFQLLRGGRWEGGLPKLTLNPINLGSQLLPRVQTFPKRVFGDGFRVSGSPVGTFGSALGFVWA